MEIKENNPWRKIPEGKNAIPVSTDPNISRRFLWALDEEKNPSLLFEAKEDSTVIPPKNKLPKLKNYKLDSVIKGDKKISSISAASIIAKVARDNSISNLGKKHKGYFWDLNYGYGTKQHLEAIKKLGITVHHRKTFSPINKYK